MLKCLKRLEIKLLILLILLSLLSVTINVYLFSFEISFKESLVIQPKEDSNRPFWFQPPPFRETNTLAVSSSSQETFFFNEDSVADIPFIHTPILQEDREIDSQSIACFPKFKSHSKANAKLYFPSREFTKCKKLVRSNTIIQVKGNLATLQCPTPRGYYILGAHSSTERLGRVEYKVNYTEFVDSITISLRDREFLMVKCSYSIKQAYLRNLFNTNASKRALSISKNLSQHLPNPTPFGVHIIMLDSVSRPHFFRSLPRTISFLNTLTKSKQYVVYDFLINNANGDNTRPNLVPLLLGKNFQDHQKTISALQNDRQEDEIHYESIQNTSLWKHYERLGYVTLFGFDTVWNFLCTDIGRTVHTDSAVLNFWNAAKNVFFYSDFVKRHRCFGNKNAHRYLLDYQTEFISNYKGHNKFSYVHTSVAHENTGTVVRTLDEDLRDSLKEVLKTYQENREDFVIVLASDHGRRVAEWDLTDEGIFENKYPFHLLISSKGVIQRMGNETHAVLVHNTERLVSRLDWYLSLLNLAHFPYGMLEKDSGVYKQYKNQVGVKAVVDLFSERVPNGRMCSDVDIDTISCLCRDYELIDVKSELVRTVLKDLLVQMVEYVNYYLIYSEVCKKITVKEILSASEFVLKPEIDGGNRHLKLDFTVKEDEFVRFEIKFYAAEAKEMKKMKIKFENYPSMQVFGEELAGYVVKVEDFQRTDVSSCPVSGKEQKVCVC